MKRVFFSVGDASGDLYIAQLARHLVRLIPDLQLEGIGGALMAQAGVSVFAQTPAFGAFGAWSGFQMGLRLWTIFQRLKRELSENQPKLFIPVDFGAFNKRLILPLARKGVKVFYFVPPSFWGVPAEKLTRYAHPNIVFAPIYSWQAEKLKKAGTQVVEFGHPILDALEPTLKLSPKEAYTKLQLPLERKVIAIMPGSRLVTVRENLPILLNVAKQLNKKASNFHFAIGLAPDWQADWTKGLLKRYDIDFPLSVHMARSHELLKVCDLAILVAGTVTLEAACLSCPSIAVFWTGWLNRVQLHWLRLQGTSISSLAPFALPNRILGEVVMPEFIGWQVNINAIVEAAWQILTDKASNELIRHKLSQVLEKLGSPGATERVANFLSKWLDELPTSV